MTRAFPILALVLLTGCTERSTEPVASASAPVPPELTQEIASACPPLNQLPDKTIGTLAVEDANAASDYAKCQEKHGTLVLLYYRVRQEILDFIEELEGSQEEPDQ